MERVYEQLDKLQARDKMKEELVKKKGITLITIPYWWDGRIDRLVPSAQSGTIPVIS